MSLDMQQKHEMKKHFIKESYKNKMKDMKNEIHIKTENLKKMLNGVDDILQNWKEIQKETEIELDKKSTYLSVYKKEVKQIDYQIELEEEKIKELKDELERKKQLSSHDYKARLHEIDQLEKKKAELKQHNDQIIDTIDQLEDRKEDLEVELSALKNKILDNARVKKQLKDREINERKKQSEIKDQLYEKKRHMDTLQDDVTTKAKEVQELKKLLNSLNNETQELEQTFNDNESMERYIDDELRESTNMSNNKQIERQIFEFFSDIESNPRKHSVIKVSDREYQVGTHLLYPIFQKERVMLNTPTGQMSLYEFYQKFLNKSVDKTADKLISNKKDKESHFIFSGQQFELSNEVDDNSRSIHSQFEVNDHEEDKIEFQLEDDGKDGKVSFLESVGSNDSYLIMSKDKSKRSPSQDFEYIGESGDKNKVPVGSPLMNKKDKKIPSKSTKIAKKTKSRLTDLIMRNQRDNQNNN